MNFTKQTIRKLLFLLLTYQTYEVHGLLFGNIRSPSLFFQFQSSTIKWFSDKMVCIPSMSAAEFVRRRRIRLQPSPLYSWLGSGLRMKSGEEASQIPNDDIDNLEFSPLENRDEVARKSLRRGLTRQMKSIGVSKSLQKGLRKGTQTRRGTSTMFLVGAPYPHTSLRNKCRYLHVDS